MKRAFLDVYYVWINEIKLVFKDRATILLFFIVPLLYPVLYGFIYDNEVARDVPVIVVDDSHSAMARDFTRKLDATPDVEVIGYAADMQEAKEALWRKDAYGIVHFPYDFSKKIHRREQADVVLYADISSLLFYKAMKLAAMDVSLDISVDIRINEMGFDSRGVDEANMQPIRSEWVGMYNPQNGFGSFLVPAILILIIQQTLLLGISTIVGTHNDRKTFTLASHTFEGKNVNAFRLTLGKALCYWSLYIIICVWVFRVVPYIFRLPQIGDPLTIAAFLMPFVLASVFFSMTLSYFASQREFGMLLFIFTSLLFVMLSGVTWPWISMPPTMKAIAYLFPSTPGVQGFIRINTMGATLSEVRFEYLALWTQSAVYWVAATFMYRWWIRNYDPRWQGRNPKAAKRTRPDESE